MTMLVAALGYAKRGWPVFPCHQETKQPLVGARAGDPKGSGGLKRATTDEKQIREWWKQWPLAMIGIPTGTPIGAFVIDIDAGVDKETGEFHGADELIANLQTATAELPETWMVETPRGGRHIYFAAPLLDAIHNRAGLLGPKSRIDVRGEGGYVIAPPSEREDGKAYTWMVAPSKNESGRTLRPEMAPVELQDCVMRLGKWAPAAAAPTSSSTSAIAGDEALHKYALTAFDAETRKVAGAGDGTRNATLNEAAFSLGQLVGAGLLVEATVRAALEGIAQGWPNFRKSKGTIDSGLRGGMAQPRDLNELKRKSDERMGRGRGTRMGARLSVVSETKAEPPPSEASEPRQLEMREILRRHRRRVDPPAAEPRSGIRAGQWTPDRLGLPDEDPCPVIPLGFDAGVDWFLNSSGQLIGWTEGRFNHAGIQRLFAATPNWPEWAYPRYGRARKIVDHDTGEERTIIPIESFKDDEVRKGLFRASERKGMFSPEQKVRGRGMWKMDDGSIRYHAGEELWIVEGGSIRAIETGIVSDGSDELVFPRMASLPPPWPKMVEPAENPARQLLEGFRQWNWDRPDIDPILLLGWIGVAFLGGALDWRPAVFLIGDKGTGKSTLQDALKAIFGDALFDRANTTAADIYQKMAHDSRPVAVDEIEGSNDNRNTMNVMAIARQSASGAFGGRGGSDATGGSEFHMSSAFLFSAINTPPLMPQDLSRFALLRLRELPPTASPPASVDVDTCGRMILARVMLEWHRFPRTLEAYKTALAAGGHSGRGQDTYGTLLAAADLILGPELAEELGVQMVDDLSAWSTLLHIDTLPEVGDALANWRACVNHLMQNRVPTWRSGERATVGQLLDDIDDKVGGRTAEGMSFEHARRQLAQAGLGLAYERDRGLLLAVPNQSPLLEQLFFGSRWQGAPGAGGWSEALRSGPRDVCFSEAQGNRVRINGVQQRCTLIAIKRLDDDKGGQSPSADPSVAA